MYRAPSQSGGGESTSAERVRRRKRADSEWDAVARYATAPERFAHLLGTLHARVVAAGGGTGRRVRQADPDTLEMIGIAAAGGVLAAGTRVETAGGVAADPTVRTGSGGRLFHRVPAERESRFQPAVRTARSESAASRSSARELSPILRS